MRLTLEFGSKAKHSARKVNEALLVALKATSAALEAEREAHEETKNQLANALNVRVVKGHQMRQALTVIDGGKARYPLDK